MTSTSATSSIISALGAGSGIDYAGLVQNLASAQFAAKIDRNAARAETVDRQISAASTLKNSLLQLASSIGDRVRGGDLSSQPAIGNGAVASVSRGSVSGKGSYTLEVTSLAARQVVSSPPFASGSAPAGSGTLTFRFGTVSGADFAEDAAQSPAAVTIPAGASLSDVAAAINAGNLGVSAYVATGSAGAQLMLKSQEGAANGFIVEASAAEGGEALSALAWTPASAPAQLQSTAQDAAFKLDGLAMTRASNTMTDLVPGLNLTLTGTNPGAPTTVRFAEPGAAIDTFMADLVSALNELAGDLNAQTDPLSGDLARDSGARAIRKSLSQLASSVMMPGANGEPATLAELGLATNRDGTFRLDTAQLAKARKASPEGVAAMFTTGIHGIYATFDKLARNLTAASNPGSITGSLSRLTSHKQNLAKEAGKLAEAQDRLRARLTTQFSGTESRVSASKSTLSFLQNQIDAWNAGSK